MIVADVGYGSEENYRAFQKNKSCLYKTQQARPPTNKYIQSKTPFSADRLYYKKENECYYCPMGQAMQNISTWLRTTRTGFTQTLHLYQAKIAKAAHFVAYVTRAKAIGP